MLGITFKENCGDIRNTKIIDVIEALKDYGMKITVHDPWANGEEVNKEYALEIQNSMPNTKFDAVILGVAHQDFLHLDLKSNLKENSVVYDVKGILQNADGTL